jgi:hypothetical protein
MIAIMAKNNVLVNGLSAVTSGSSGMLMTFPDVCKTQVGPAVVPIPYPNIAQSADQDKGSKSVMIEGKPVCLESSTFSKSTGDEAGSLKGLISSEGQGEAKPLLFSPTVFIEGKAVVRNTDIFTSNKMNTPPAPIMQAQVAPAIAGAIKDVEVEINCIRCSKPKNKKCQEGKVKLKKNKTVGCGTKLTKAIVKNAGYGKIENHPWHFTRARNSGQFSSLQAHHLIVSQSTDDVDIKKLCLENSYDINSHENGVMLPYYQDLACLLSVPLHNTNHNNGETDVENPDPKKEKGPFLSYPGAVETKLEGLKKLIKKGYICNAKDPQEEFVNSMNDISKLIFDKIVSEDWTITGAGKDYYKESDDGCKNSTSSDSKIQNKPCEFRKNKEEHYIVNSNGVQIKIDTNKLELGK